MDPPLQAASRPTLAPAPVPVPGQGSRGRGGLRPMALRVAGWGLLALALALTFRLYLDPSLTLDFGAFMQLCGLR